MIPSCTAFIRISRNSGETRLSMHHSSWSLTPSSPSQDAPIWERHFFLSVSKWTASHCSLSKTLHALNMTTSANVPPLFLAISQTATLPPSHCLPPLLRPNTMLTPPTTVQPKPSIHETHFKPRSHSLIAHHQPVSSFSSDTRSLAIDPLPAPHPHPPPPLPTTPAPPQKTK